MRSSHQSVERMSSIQAREMFQSSMTSWSSKIIIEGSEASSQRSSSGWPQASRYSRVYSSKSATSSPGGREVSRRARMKARVRGEALSA